MGFSLFGDGGFGSGLIGMGLFGSDGDSRAEGVNYPKWFEDPRFNESQDFLNQYSKDLLTSGPNDYYRPIGEYGTPEFMDFIQQGNAKTMMGVDEVLARGGRGRGGRAGEVAAQALGDRNADLMYKDYIRAMQGREMFFNTGLNTQANVRDAGFQNQTAKNNFNVGGANFEMGKAQYLDSRDDMNSEALGKILGTVAPIAGAGIGAMFGNPIAGYQIGSMVTGGPGADAPSGIDWLDAVMGTKQRSSSPAAEEAGVSDIGRIGMKMDPDKLMEMFSGLN